MTRSIASAPNVFDTATSVTEAGSRPAARQACAISWRTASSRSLESLTFIGVFQIRLPQATIAYGTNSS
jgi:hypothetical protein